MIGRRTFLGLLAGAVVSGFSRIETAVAARPGPWDYIEWDHTPDFTFHGAQVYGDFDVYRATLVFITPATINVLRPNGVIEPISRGASGDPTPDS